MISALRRLAGTWPAKVLFVLLILSFAIWGVGDMVTGAGRDTAVARVDGQPIEFDEAQAAMRREMQRLARALGPQFDADERVRAALARQALDTLVMDRVLRRETERLGLAVPDAAVRDFVFALEGFRGADGSFSRAVFDAFLRSNGLTEQGFLAFVRADLTRQQMSAAIRAGAAAPETLAAPLLRWRDEQRDAVIVGLRTADAPDPPEPTDAALRRFHENNPERFSTPELRTATVAVMTAERLTREVEIGEDALRAAYEQNAARYQQPETRGFTQALLPTEDAARQIADRWQGGAAEAEIAAAAEQAGGQVLDLGTFDRAGMPVPELAEAGFALPAGGVSAPIRSAFGWHVLRVAAIAPAETRTLDKVRDELRRELAQERAADIAFERANRIEDALAGGATIEEVAQRFDLGLARLTTDARGRDAEGATVALPVIEAAREPLLAAVFAAERGAAPRLRETEAGFVAIDLHDVQPPALRPFATVEAAVRAAFIADARRRAQEERAAALLAATRAGTRLQDVAAQAGLTARELGGIRRDPNEAGAAPPELLAPLFELPLHDVTMVATREGFAVAQVTAIIAADPAADPAALAALRNELTQAIAQELDVQFLTALRGRAALTVNQRLMDQLARP
jgi:peptidyl-prolyl cis-trans isomerase D